MQRRACENCDYWFNTTAGKEQQCRRDPPKMLGDIMRLNTEDMPLNSEAVWPHTSPGDRCGEYSIKLVEDDD